ncbi:MAG TPA: hypothetical protein VGJ20_29185 [Xanthobacteraceae bacterium]|jgi:hypothetical protein
MFPGFFYGWRSLYRTGLPIYPSEGTEGEVEWCMAKEQEAVDNLLDALVWMRRKAKKREPVDALIDELVKMRRKAKKKVAKKKPSKRRKTARAKR